MRHVLQNVLKIRSLDGTLVFPGGRGAYAACHALPGKTEPGEGSDPMRSLLTRVMGSEEHRSSADVPALPTRRSVIGVVPLSAVDELARTALSTALSMSAGRVVAVHVCGSEESSREFTRAWEQWEPGVPLVLLDRVAADGDTVAASISDYLSRRHTAYQTLVVIVEGRTPPRTGLREPGSPRADALEAALLPLPHVVVCRRRQDRVKM